MLPAAEASDVDFALIIGTLLLILPILPALNLNALNPGDFLHGRYTYLPLAGLALILASLCRFAGRVRIAALAAVGAIAVAYTPFTLAQQKQWKDDLTVFTAAHELAPHNAPVARNLADARVRDALLLEEDGHCPEAIPVFEEISREYPDDGIRWPGSDIAMHKAMTSSGQRTSCTARPTGRTIPGLFGSGRNCARRWDFLRYSHARSSATTPHLGCFDAQFRAKFDTFGSCSIATNTAA
jgi:hypothetical protein